jgi:hypothetical protein
MGEAKRRQHAAVRAIDTTPVAKKAIMLDGVGIPKGNPETNVHWNAGIEELARRAFDAQGPAAFECSPRAAAIHEAGHCVVHTMLDNKLADCRIEERRIVGRSIWLGVTNMAGSQCWESSPESNPYDDLDHAAITFAGVAAEMAFDTDFRQGSSLDELVLYQMLCSNAANKLRLSPERMIMWMHANVGKMLHHHKDVHRAITEALFHKQTLGADDLAELVRPVTPLGKRAWGRPALINMTSSKRPDPVEIEALDD